MAASRLAGISSGYVAESAVPRHSGINCLLESTPQAAHCWLSLFLSTPATKNVDVFTGGSVGHVVPVVVFRSQGGSAVESALCPASDSRVARWVR